MLFILKLNVLNEKQRTTNIHSSVYENEINEHFVAGMHIHCFKNTGLAKICKHCDNKINPGFFCRRISFS